MLSGNEYSYIPKEYTISTADGSEATIKHLHVNYSFEQIDEFCRAISENFDEVK